MHDEEECEDYDVNGVVCRGHLVDAELKELLPSIPVVYIRAVAVDPSWGKFLNLKKIENLVIIVSSIIIVL